MRRCGDFFTAAHILDLVEGWAGALQGEYWLVRESIAAVEELGRIDGLLVPASFRCGMMKAQNGHWLDKVGMIGVEVKASREDFQRGLREGQFQRYLKSDVLSALYVATTRDVKTSEIPAGCGHLVAYKAKGVGVGSCVCRRKPTFRPAKIDHNTLWRLLFYAVGKVNASKRARHHEVDRIRDRIGHAVERKVFAVIERAMEAEAAR